MKILAYRSESWTSVDIHRWIYVSATLKYKCICTPLVLVTLGTVLRNDRDPTMEIPDTRRGNEGCGR